MLHFQVELLRTNLKLPFLDSSHTNNHLYIIYQSIMEMLTFSQNVTQQKLWLQAAWFCVARNIWLNYEGRRLATTRKRLWRVRAPRTRFCVAYSYRKSMSIIERVIYIEFLASYIPYIRDPSRVQLFRCLSKSTGWAIIEDLSIRRRVCTFLISWGQKTCEKHCYVD